MLVIKDRLVLRQFRSPEKTASGIFVEKKENPPIAIVVFVGPEVKAVKPGHVVVLGTKWFTNLKLGDEDLLVVNEPDIVGVLEKAELEELATKHNFLELAELKAA